MDAATSGAESAAGTPSRACPGCGGGSAKPVGEDAGYAWVRCGRCSTTFVQRAVLQGELDAYYASYYDATNLEVPPIVQQRLDEVVATFAPYRRTGRLLDVGFGAGTLLEAAARAGWECWGTEVSSSALIAAESTGWKLEGGDLPDLDLPLSSFDVICMVEVLEHVPDPRQQLVAALPLLRPGGLLYGTTPNGRGISGRLLGLDWSAYAAPEHLQLFTPASLTTTLRGAGYQHVEVHSRGTNPYELRNGLRRGKAATAAATRVQSGYELNTRLESSAFGRLVRSVVNTTLAAASSGDSLVLRAERASAAAQH